jgi:two-component system cell cycle sensor histidine kinase/response regulator CckA
VISNGKNNSPSDSLLKISLSIQQMNASIDVVDVMGVCFQEMHGFCDRIHAMAIHQVVDADKNQVETFRIGTSGVISPLHIRKSSLLPDMWRAHSTSYQPDVQSEYPPDELELLEAKFDGMKIVSMLDVPFSSGVISAQSSEAHAFDHDVVEMLKQVAEVFSVGLSRVRDLETIEKRVAELDLFAERYSLAVNAGKTGVWDLDLESDAIFVDGILWKLLGQERESCRVPMEEWTSFVYADDYPKLVDLARAHFSDDSEIYEVEYRMVHEDGTLRWFLSRGQAVRAADGTAVRLVGTSTDISDLKQMEKALQRARRDLEERVKERTSELEEANLSLLESRERLDAQLAGIPVPTYTWQRQIKGFVLVAHNEPAAERTDGRVRDYVGKTTLEWFKDPDFPMARDIERCFEQRSTIRREMQSKMPQTGRTLDLDITYVFVKPDYVIVHTVDLSERRRLETQLRQAQKMDAVGRLAGGVAHDFNNLLTVINGYSTQMLLDPHALDSREALEGIRSAGERASILTRRLLTFSKQQVMNLKPIQLNAVVRDTDRLLRRLIGEDIEFRTQLSPKSDWVMADVGQMEQVVMNLVLNARDAMPRGGRVFVTTSYEEKGSPGDKLSFMRLTVSDEGTGMDSELQERIFEPFFTTKDKRGGTGLGLSISYGIVSQCGGWMEVESEPEKGSTFSVCLPTTDESPEVFEKLTSGVSEPETFGKILLVEDEALVRLFTSRILKVCGYEVIEAKSGEDALEKIHGSESDIDLLLTDVVMPQISGGELASRLKQGHPDLKVIYMSGYNDDEVMRYGVSRSDDSFLQKPFTRDVLVQRIQEQMRQGDRTE